MAARETDHLPRPHLLVRAGDALCALPLAAVRRVARALPVQRLPGAEPALLGLAEHAGEPLPVLELARLLGAAPGAAPRHPVSVVAWAGPPDARELVALAADAALEVTALDPAAIRPRSGRGPVAGQVELAGAAVHVLDLAALAAVAREEEAR